MPEITYLKTFASLLDRAPKAFAAATALLLVMGSLATPAASQEPTSAQRDAIRAQCRSDYMAHCASVPPGGKDSLMCLKTNMARLSPSCQQAVNAIVGAPAAAAAPAAPAAAPTAAATTSSSVKPATRPPARQPVATVTATAPSAVPATTAPSATAATPATAGMMAPGRPIPLRAEIFLIRSACGAEFRALCSAVPPGGGRVISCLQANVNSLSPRCQGALVAMQ